jgi:glutaconate CoA-transferase subunit B
MNGTSPEIMTIMAAREIHNGDIVFCGTGISMLAAMAAKNISAPDSVIFFESGAVDALLEDLPWAVSDSRVMWGANSTGGLMDAFATMQNRITGNRVIAILGAAQIDIYGNLNTTAIGDYSKPDTRFAGSGGGCDVASFVPRCIVFMHHERRKFVRKLDYRTSPGNLDGPEARRRAGLPPGGITCVVTNMAVMRFDEDTKEMYLDRFYPGITPQQVLEHMEFAVDISRARPADPPTEEELRILRGKCDPRRMQL